MKAVLVPFVTLGRRSASRPVVFIPLLLGLAVVFLALSASAVEAGDPIAWGYNFSGQCDVPADLPRVIAIAAGGHHSLALTEAGEVIAWGNNRQGQCDVPADLPRVTAIAAGYGHSLALTDTGEVIAWNYNYYGQCNVPAEAKSGVIAIAAGALHSLALTEAGEVIAWGYSVWGQCDVPLEAKSSVTAIAGGGEHSLALTDTGEVTAWGNNRHGQCDVPAEAQSGVLAITGGEYHSLALLLPPPVTEFSGSPTSGTVPLTVEFTDLSAGEVASWEWDFGDGSTSTQQNPSHLYETPRRYAVSLTAGNASGSDTETKARYIVVNFVDVATDNWAYGEIMGCADADIVTGYPDGSYQPDGPVNRAEMAVYISRALAGGDEYVPDPTTDPGFTDVDETHWTYQYIAYAVEQNIVQGYPDGDYRPAAIVARDQMAVYVARALVAPAGEAALAAYVPADPRNFPDVLDTGYGEDGTEAHWAYRYVEYCIENGVVQGYEDGLYRPDRDVTRDQMAVYVARAFGRIH